jgi:hypothetical protein
MKKVLFVLMFITINIGADPLTASESVDDTDIVGRSGWVFVEDSAFVQNKETNIESNIEQEVKIEQTVDSRLVEEVKKEASKLDKKENVSQTNSELFSFENKKDGGCHNAIKKSGCKSSR